MTVPTYGPDLFSAQAIQHPHEHYRALQALGPVVWLEATGCWVTTNYAAAVQVLSTDEVFLSGRGVSLNDQVNRVLVGSTLNSDGPDHAKRKKVSIRPLMPKNVEPNRHQIARVAHKIVDALSSDTDGVLSIAQQMPLCVVTQMVGVGARHEQSLLRWATATFNAMGPDNDLSKEHRDDLADLRQFVQNPNVEAELDPTGWAAALFQAEAKGQIPPGWAREQMRDYLNPALDTTIAVIAYGLMMFAQNPDQWSLAQERPDLLTNAVEEMARLSTPIRGFSRYIASDTAVEGQALTAEQRIFVLFAAANRDVAVFAEPDAFDITRQTTRHLGFGYGKHFCLGKHLARIEIQEIFRALLGRVRTISLAGEPTIGLNNTIYGLKHLPLHLEFY